MTNTFLNIYELYKSFFDKNNIDYQEVMSMYNKHFGSFQALNYDELKKFVNEELNRKSSFDVDATDIMNKQQILREINQALEYNSMNNQIMLYDNRNRYYIIGIQNDNTLQIKPLNQIGNKTMTCDSKGCILQVKQGNGLLEEKISFGSNKSVLVTFYDNDSLEEISQNIVLPSFYSINDIDPEIIPEHKITYELDKINNSGIFSQYENVILKSKEEIIQTKKTMYEQVQDKLREINFDEMISNKRTR